MPRGTHRAETGQPQRSKKTSHNRATPVSSHTDPPTKVHSLYTSDCMYAWVFVCICVHQFGCLYVSKVLHVCSCHGVWLIHGFLETSRLLSHNFFCRGGQRKGCRSVRSWTMQTLQHLVLHWLWKASTGPSVAWLRMWSTETQASSSQWHCTILYISSLPSFENMVTIPTLQSCHSHWILQISVRWQSADTILACMHLAMQQWKATVFIC